MNHVTNLFMEDLQFIMIASGLGEFYIIIIHHHERIKKKVVGRKQLSTPLISKKIMVRRERPNHKQSSRESFQLHFLKLN